MARRASGRAANGCLLRCLRWSLHCFLPCVLLLAAGVAAAALPAPDPPAPAPSAEPTSSADDGSWVRRTLRRYFGDRTPTGADLEGRAEALFERYADQAGKVIEVVIVHQVARFDRDVDLSGRPGSALLGNLGQPFHSYTREAVIRQYLLFDRGQRLDPFRLADSERLLRELDFINDVRLFVVPLTGDEESVAVVVETRDRWPFGASAATRGVDRYEAELYHSNVAGLDIRFANRLFYRGDAEPELGYRGRLRKRNMAGSFITVELEYEDTWRELQRLAQAERVLAHPGIAWVGGVAWENTDQRDAPVRPLKFERSDLWLGDVVRLPDGARARGERPVLVPAVRFARTDYRARPEVRPDTNLAYQQRRHYLAGVTYARLAHYKTSYLYRMGETEDITAGRALKLSGGYEDGEFYGRTSANAQAWWTVVHRRGDVVHLAWDLGGFYHAGVFEDGALGVAAAYVSPLRGGDAYQHRLYVDVRYHRGIKRLDPGGLSLGDASGVRGMEDGRVRGDQRLVVKCESRLFTPWSLLGFRCMAVAFADAGAVAAERGRLLGGTIYTSLGLGLRINNPELVLPTLQLRLALLRSIDDNGMLLAFDVGGVNYPEVRVPDARPGGFTFR